MAAEGQEVVLGSYPRQLEHLGPDLRELALEPLRRLLVAGGAGPVLGGRLRQGAPVDLAVRRQGEPVEGDERGRVHVLGQAPVEERAQRERIGPLASRAVRDHVRDQRLDAGDLPRQDQHLGHPRILRQRCLDLPRLDAEAADLHLVVVPADEIEPAVRPPTDQVTGAVQPVAGAVAGRRRRGGERVGHEPLGGQRRPAPVPPGDALAADQELPDHPHRNRSQLRVDHVDRRVGDRPADRHRLVHALRAAHRIEGRERRVLGRAVEGAQPDAGADLERPAAAHRRDDVAAGHHVARRRQALRPLLDDPVEQAGGHPQGGHSLAGDQQGQLVDRRRPRRRQHQPSAVEQRAPDLQGRGVERGRGELEEGLLRPEIGVVRVPDQPGDRPLRHGHTLGTAGRPGGVGDVGQVVRPGAPGPGRTAIAVSARRSPVHGHDGDSLRHRQTVQGVPVGQQHGGADVVEHPGQALPGIVGIERHVATTGLEDRQHAGHHLDRALDGERHRRAPLDPGGHQASGQDARAYRELSVGDLTAGRTGALDQGHSIGPEGDLLGEQLGDPAISRIGREPARPLLGHQALSLGSRCRRLPFRCPIHRQSVVHRRPPGAWRSRDHPGATSPRPRAEAIGLLTRSTASLPIPEVPAPPRRVTADPHLMAHRDATLPGMLRRQ